MRAHKLAGAFALVAFLWPTQATAQSSPVFHVLSLRTREASGGTRIVSVRSSGGVRVRRSGAAPVTDRATRRELSELLGQGLRLRHEVIAELIRHRLAAR